MLVSLAVFYSIYVKPQTFNITQAAICPHLYDYMFYWNITDDLTHGLPFT